MAKHIWSVLCYKGCLDQFTNQVSLLDVLEQVEVQPIEPVPEGPNTAVPINLHLITLWTRSDPSLPESANTRHGIVTPDGERAVQKEHVVKLDEHVRSRTFLRFDSLPYRGNGYYLFVVELQDELSKEWRVVAEVPLQFTIRPFVPNEQEASPRE